VEKKGKPFGGRRKPSVYHKESPSLHPLIWGPSAGALRLRAKQAATIREGRGHFLLAPKGGCIGQRVGESLISLLIHMGGRGERREGLIVFLCSMVLCEINTTKEGSIR